MRSGLIFSTFSRRLLKASVATLVAVGIAVAQEPTAPAAPQNSNNAAKGWPRAGDPSRTVPSEQTGPPEAQEPPAPLANANDPGYQQNAPYQNSPNQNGPYAPAPQGPPPAQLTLRPGTFVTVRVNQTLSSDHNHPGDAFSATLTKPIVVDGVVIAQRGQTLGGRVTDAEKAGRVEGTSRLGIQLTDLTLVDGQQIPIQSQLASRTGGTSVGRDAGAVAGTTGLGAAIGAAAGWGKGAAIGAGAGAAAGVIGVLLTRGRPSVIYPESVLTFRVEAPVTISTTRAPQAFHYVEPGDYDQPQDHQAPMYAQAPPIAPCAGYGCGAPPPYYWGPAYYPYWGPSFYFYRGPRFYGPRYFGPRYYGPRRFYHR